VAKAIAEEFELYRAELARHKRRRKAQAAHKQNCHRPRKRATQYFRAVMIERVGSGYWGHPLARVVTMLFLGCTARAP